MKLALIAMLPALAWAQQPVVKDARLTLGDGSGGRCSGAVTVDGTAEVEIAGARGWLRTLSGKEAAWGSLECSGTVPASAVGFAFTATSGRGDQYLIREPRENGGAALIRIEDPRGGAEPYVFEIVWSDARTLAAEGGFADGGFKGGIVNPAGAGSRVSWDAEIDQRGAGDGYYRSVSAADALLSDGVIRIGRDGRVRMDFETNQRYRLQLTGRLVHAARNRLVAAMGGAAEGTMEIVIDGRNRVREISMSGSGRSRFELRWQAK